jgi:hypothetical protein
MATHRDVKRVRSRNEPESPISRAFVESLCILGYAPDASHGEYGPRMFHQSNEKGLFAILHFLLTKMVKDATSVFFKTYFRFKVNTLFRNLGLVGRFSIMNSADCSEKCVLR